MAHTTNLVRGPREDPGFAGGIWYHLWALSPGTNWKVLLGRVMTFFLHDLTTEKQQKMKTANNQP